MQQKKTEKRAPVRRPFLSRFCSVGFLEGLVALDQLADRVLARNIDVAPRSARQDYLENLVNRFNA